MKSATGLTLGHTCPWQTLKYLKIMTQDMILLRKPILPQQELSCTCFELLSTLNSSRKQEVHYLTGLWAFYRKEKLLMFSCAELGKENTSIMACLLAHHTLLGSLGREGQQPDVVPSWFLQIELGILL